MLSTSHIQSMATESIWQSSLAKAQQAGQAFAGGKSGQAESAREATLRKAANEFEAVFISQMMQHMTSGLEPDPLFGGGAAEEISRSLLHQEYGKLMSGAGGIGISDAVYAQLLKQQEVGA